MADKYPWQEQVDSRLASIANLGFGWNGPGSTPVDPRAIEAARKFLGPLSIVASAFPALYRPSIGPSDEGGVQAVWVPKGGAWATVEFTSAGLIEAIGRDANGEDQQFGYPPEQ